MSSGSVESETDRKITAGQSRGSSVGSGHLGAVAQRDVQSDDGSNNTEPSHDIVHPPENR